METPSSTVAEPPLRQFTRKDYHAMADAGILTPRDRVELINGKIIAMMPIGDWHWSSAARLHYALTAAYGNRAIVVSGSSIGLGDTSEPQPDIGVYRWQADFYASGIPDAQRTILLVEVADSSRVYDLGTKHDLYAQHGIREYWVVDGKRRCVHVFRDPQDGAYREVKVYQSGESIPLPEGDGSAIPLSETGL